MNYEAIAFQVFGWLLRVTRAVRLLDGHPSPNCVSESRAGDIHTLGTVGARYPTLWDGIGMARTVLLFLLTFVSGRFVVFPFIVFEVCLLPQYPTFTLLWRACYCRQRCRQAD
jgi:hypothetical protein